MRKATIKNIGHGGFTLIEIMVALVLSMGILATMISLSTTGIKQIRSVKYAQQLNDNASSLANNFTYLIKQAMSLNVSPDGKQLEILLRDSVTKKIISRKFLWSGNTVTLNENPVLGSNVEVTNLAFTPMLHSVRISYTLRLHNTNETITINTTVAKRNSL